MDPVQKIFFSKEIPKLIIDQIPVEIQNKRLQEFRMIPAMIFEA